MKLGAPDDERGRGVSGGCEAILASFHRAAALQTGEWARSTGGKERGKEERGDSGSSHSPAPLQRARMACWDVVRARHTAQPRRRVPFAREGSSSPLLTRLCSLARSRYCQVLWASGRSVDGLYSTGELGASCRKPRRCCWRRVPLTLSFSCSKELLFRCSAA